MRRRWKTTTTESKHRVTPRRPPSGGRFAWWKAARHGGKVRAKRLLPYKKVIQRQKKFARPDSVSIRFMWLSTWRTAKTMSYSPSRVENKKQLVLKRCKRSLRCLWEEQSAISGAKSCVGRHPSQGWGRGGPKKISANVLTVKKSVIRFRENDRRI